MKAVITFTLLFIYGLLTSSKIQAQNFQWAKKIGGLDYDDVTGIKTDGGGNILIVGSFKGLVDFDPGPGSFNLNGTSVNGNIFITKLDSSGHFIWAKMLDGGSSSYFSSGIIRLDNFGNIYITGLIVGTVDFDPGPGVANMSSIWNGYSSFILKLDSSANYSWTKIIGGYGSSIGCADISVDSFNNLTLSGSFSGPVDFDPGVGNYTLSTTIFGQYDVFVLRLDSWGNFVWVKTIGGGNSNQSVASQTMDVSGNIYITGSFDHTPDCDPGPGIFNVANNGLDDVFILKLDYSGGFIWAKSIGGIDYDEGGAICVDLNGGIYVTGVFRTTVDLDPGIGTMFCSSLGQADIFMIRLNQNGNFIWSKTIGGPGNDYSGPARIGLNGHIYCAGSFSGSTDFDPGPGVFNLTSIGWYDTFLYKLDSLGNFDWAKQFTASDSTGYSFPITIDVDLSDNLYTSGSFMGIVDFNPDAGIDTLSSYPYYDIFISKLGKCNTLLNASSNMTICSGESATISASGASSYTWMPGGVNIFSFAVSPTVSTTYTVTGDKSSDCQASSTIEVNVDLCTNTIKYSNSQSLTLFPNPNNGKFEIKSTEPIIIKLINDLGQLLESIQLDEENQFSSTVSNLSNGIYFIVSEKGSQKIIVYN